MAVLLSPVFNLPAFVDASGNPANGFKVFQYEAGSSSVLKETFTDNTGTVGNANPIVLNSAGQLPSGIAIWLTEGEAYNLVLTEADGTTVIKGFDNVIGVQADTVGTPGQASVWIAAPGAIYLSPTQFRVTGNLTTEFAVGNRAQVSVSSAERYGTVSAVSFSSPDTTVTLVNDGVGLDSSVSAAYYSVLIAAGRTIDAGAVSYTSSFSYATSNTVGNKIKALEVDDTTTNTRIDALRKVWLASYAAGAYAITPSPAVTSYSTDMVFTVAFANAGTGGTLNVNGVGAKSLKMYDTSGAKVAATITAGVLSTVAYDGVDFIVLNQLPPVPPDGPARGMVVFTTNGTWTAPDGVTFAKVTCVGGGGGSGNGYSPNNLIGGAGGGGAVAIKGATVVPGTVYAISIGAGGAATAAGGSTTFAVSTVIAAGGGGGANSSTSFDGVNGTGGSTGNGDLIIAGAAGSRPYGGSTPGFSVGAALYGGGANSSTGTGTSGYPGVCIVEF